MSRGRFVPITVIATLVASGTIILARGAFPSSDGRFWACVNAENGNVRIIDPTTTSCRTNEILISWNQTGTAGASGATGAAGTNGATGATGVAGTNGATGPDGAIGATGPQGSTGANGTNGNTGAQGPVGAAGAIGATGPLGATGAQGATGATGPANVAALQGSPCSYSGVSGIIQVSYSGTGIVQLACVAP